MTIGEKMKILTLLLLMITSFSVQAAKTQIVERKQELRSEVEDVQGCAKPHFSHTQVHGAHIYVTSLFEVQVNDYQYYLVSQSLNRKGEVKKETIVEGSFQVVKGERVVERKEFTRRIRSGNSFASNYDALMQECLEEKNTILINLGLKPKYIDS